MIMMKIQHGIYFVSLRFRSFSGLRKDGFKMIYNRKRCPSIVGDSSVICSADCSQTIREANGNVTFANNNTFARTNCAFDIIQGPGSYIRIMKINVTLPCHIGFLEIRDGSHENSPLMGKFCEENYNVPEDFQSSQNHIVLR